MITVEQLQGVLNDSTLTERQKTIKIEILNSVGFNHELQTSVASGINPDEASEAIKRMFNALKKMSPVKISHVCEVMDNHFTKRELAFQLACDFAEEFGKEDSVIEELPKIMASSEEN